MSWPIAIDIVDGSPPRRIFSADQSEMRVRMEQVLVVGLDLAKSVFQVHGVNARGEAVLRHRLTRGQLLKRFEKLLPCLVGMEACASAHHWAHELTELWHEVKLMPPQYVKPYLCQRRAVHTGSVAEWRQFFASRGKAVMRLAGSVTGPAHGGSWVVSGMAGSDNRRAHLIAAARDR